MESGLPHGLAIFINNNKNWNVGMHAKNYQWKLRLCFLKSKDSSIENYISHFTTVMQILILKVTKSNM